MYFVYIVTYQASNWMGYQQFNNCLVVYIKNDAVDRIDNETIVHQFQNMKTCRIKFKDLCI